MDLIELINEKRFLGQEFLTYLWHRSETEGSIDVNGDSVEIAFDYTMQLECGEGEACRRIATKGTPTASASELVEAKTAIAVGKKIEQAKILMSVNGAEFWLTANGRLLSLTGVKLPKVAPTEDAGDDETLSRQGLVLERIGLITIVTRTIDAIYRDFLMLRTDPQAWAAEVKKISAWAEKGAI